ncbi:hypothetical protein JCM16303_001055 [Sporobolomyces ruberrimus]
MDTQPSVPVQHPLRPYSIAPPRDDFSWHASPSSRPGPSSTPPSLRYSPLDDLSSGMPSAGVLLKAFVTSSLLSFTGVALVQPFEVGKTLAQVQWIPKIGVLESIEDPNNHSNQDDDVQDEAEAESYFADLSSVSQPGFAPPPSSSSSSHLAPPRPTDPSGYLPRSDSLTRPEWVMPIVVQGGVWDMIKTIGRWKGEGYQSLWKGQLTTFIYDTLSTSLQPAFLSFLTLLFSPLSTPAFTSLPLIYSPRPLPFLLFTTLSHTLTTLLLSPLDLVRTRLIVQSSQPSHQKYSGNPLSTLRTIILEEGGLSQTYLHPNLLYPTLLEGTLRPFLHFSIPLLITRYIGIEPSTSPLSFSIFELVLSSASLLLTIPLETIRKRLQLQSRALFVRAGRVGGVGKPWRSCVELRPSPYKGMSECVWRILTEETGKLPNVRTRRLSRRRTSSAGPPPSFKRSNSGMSTSSQVVVEEDEDEVEGSQAGGGGAGGLRQLYRGLSMGIGANVVVFLLGILAGGSGIGGMGPGSGSGSGWAEM